MVRCIGPKSPFSSVYANTFREFRVPDIKGGGKYNKRKRNIMESIFSIRFFLTNANEKKLHFVKVALRAGRRGGVKYCDGKKYLRNLQKQTQAYCDIWIRKEKPDQGGPVRTTDLTFVMYLDILLLAA
ncbi:hypothetical protein TNIN_34361 [Trichonephila inaurata madagascariensis]|uniref:Uncharacterized protein n=1 Tax=Trichonephila inaurata madagascariensis TaxID=2747483 RepID=A0A8X6XTS6_9ARAC|nr:hypothetical protein TNIN_34361 [Trichonephila inaurata madagascariensis]